MILGPQIIGCMTHIATPPRVAIIVSMFPELHETFILRELVALEKAGVTFDIYSLQLPRDPITLVDAKRLSCERTTYSALINRATLGALMRSLVRQPLVTLKTCWQVIWQGRDRPLDVIKNLSVLPITLHFGEIAAARGTTHWHGHWANVPTTACWYLQQLQHTTWSAALHGEDIFSANRFLAFKLNAASFTVVCSHYFCQHLKNQLGLRHPELVHLNYHGLDPAVLERAARQTNSKTLPNDAPRQLVAIGRLVPTKGHDVVLQALAELRHTMHRQVQLEIIGSGPLESELRALSDKLGISDQVQFTGALGFNRRSDGVAHTGSDDTSQCYSRAG